MTRRRVTIFANPFSGAIDNRPRVAALIEALREKRFDAEAAWDREQWPAIAADPSFAPAHHCIVAAGGDGTLADVVNLRIDAPLTAFPLGNENLFAQAFGYTADPRMMATLIDEGRQRAIDLGRVGDRLFTLMCSVGFDAAVVHRVCQWRAAGSETRRVKRRSYALPIVQTALRYRFDPVVLRCDDRRVTGVNVIVFNLRQYGLNLEFLPDRLVGPKKQPGLEWIVFEEGGIIRLIDYALAISMHRHINRRDVHFGRGDIIEITSDHPVPAQADGDIIGHTPLRIERVPDAMRIMVYG